MTFPVIVNGDVILFWVAKRIVTTIDKHPNVNFTICTG
jgi:hypothetical protein